MRASSARAAWPSDDDYTAFSLIVILLGGLCLGTLAWINFHGTIARWVADLILWEIDLIGYFTPALDPLADKIRQADPELVTLNEIVQALGVVGDYVRLPAVILMSCLAALCFWRAAPAQFTRTLDLDGLIREQAQTFRPLAAFTDRNLRLVPLDRDRLRPADPALHAGEWIDRFARDKDGQYDNGLAHAALTAQLGAPWRGVDHARPHERFLYAVFAVHLQQKRGRAQELLGTFAAALPKGHRKEVAGPEQPYAFPEALAPLTNAILSDSAVREPADQIANRHGYTAPALMALLTAARRRGGVLSPAQFAALKLIDRSLWYALHSLGFEGDGPGQTTHPNPRVEAAGARDHWQAEHIAGRPLVIPAVGRALIAVRTSLPDHERISDQEPP